MENVIEEFLEAHKNYQKKRVEFLEYIKSNNIDKIRLPDGTVIKYWPSRIQDNVKVEVATVMTEDEFGPIPAK